MMGGQRIPVRGLHIDLSQRSPVQWERETAFLGGRGANYELLWDSGRADREPLEGPMAWACGPLIGTGIPGASRIERRERKEQP